MRIKLILALLLFGYSCEQQAPEKRSNLADREEEEKAEKEGTKPPSEKKESSLKLRFSWDESDDNSIISYRISRSDDGELKLVKEYSVEEVMESGSPMVELELDKALSPNDDEERVCFVLTAVSEGGESDPTTTRCVDLETE